MASARYAQNALFETVMSADFSDQTEFSIPVFFFAGRHDFNTPQTLVSRYVETINAPMKRLYWFEQSGHSPPWEEPQLFSARAAEAVRDVLRTQSAPLADD